MILIMAVCTIVQPAKGHAGENENAQIFHVRANKNINQPETQSPFHPDSYREKGATYKL